MPEHEWRRFLTNLMQCFLDRAVESQFVILENADVGDELVQFKMNHRILYGEVGFAEIGSTTEELEALRCEVEQAGSFEALPGWAQHWIRKAEEGPLWVVLGR
jgi:hypothetical protein